MSRFEEYRKKQFTDPEFVAEYDDLKREADVWDFIHSGQQISFPDDVKPSWHLVAEYIPEGEMFNQYRLYLDDQGLKKYAKVSLK